MKMSEDKKALVIETISGMTVLELAELVKMMEEKFGVSAAAPVAAVAAAPAAAVAATAIENTFISSNASQKRATFPRSSFVESRTSPV